MWGTSFLGRTTHTMADQAPAIKTVLTQSIPNLKTENMLNCWFHISFAIKRPGKDSFVSLLKNKNNLDSIHNEWLALSTPYLNQTWNGRSGSGKRSGVP